MITEFNIYERVMIPAPPEHKPTRGDYVVCNNTFFNHGEYILKNIGQITKDFTIADGLEITYDNGLVINVSLPEIDYYSRNKKDLESHMKGKQFDL